MGDETVVSRKKKRLDARGRVLREAHIFARLREDWAAANLGLKHAKRAAEGREIEELRVASGKRRRKKKCPAFFFILCADSALKAESGRGGAACSPQRRSFLFSFQGSSGLSK
jgi:hypothetical protein